MSAHRCALLVAATLSVSSPALAEPVPTIIHDGAEMFDVMWSWNPAAWPTQGHVTGTAWVAGFYIGEHVGGDKYIRFNWTHQAIDSDDGGPNSYVTVDHILAGFDNLSGLLNASGGGSDAHGPHVDQYMFNVVRLPQDQNQLYNFVRLTLTHVPAPGTAALIGLGSCGLAIRRRRPH